MKFFGMVGFAEANLEVVPDVFRDGIIEKKYTGDVLRSSRKFSPSEHQNDELTMSNRISIIADLYARQNWNTIKYVVWNGVKMKVTNVEIDHPRITLELGGIYNGKDPVRVESDSEEDL